MHHDGTGLRDLLDADGHLYVFAYGSLIWRPGFSHAAAHPALLRSFRVGDELVEGRGRHAFHGLCGRTCMATQLHPFGRDPL